MGKRHGRISEDYFSNLLFNKGLEYIFIDDWYDYEIEGIKVELKSCQMTIKHKNGKCDSFRIGRFDFTSEENRLKLKEENVWVALVVRHHNQCLFYGFLDPCFLNGDRYMSLHKLREYKLINFNDWIKLNKLKQKVRDCPRCGRQLVL